MGALLGFDASLMPWHRFALALMGEAKACRLMVSPDLTDEPERDPMYPWKIKNPDGTWRVDPAYQAGGAA